MKSTSIKNLQDYTVVSKYSRYLPELRRREVWDEAVKRMEDMHISVYPALEEEIRWAFSFVYEKMLLGSQRALQFGGDAILRSNLRIYNCLYSQFDRVRFLQEAFFSLLCGSGVGFSVQKHHVAKLPDLYQTSQDEVVTYVIPDSIEGWSDAVGVLVSSFMPGPFPEYANKYVEFDYSSIRPAGSPLSHGCGKAPGPSGLKLALENIRVLLKRQSSLSKRLRPIDCYDMTMYVADAVLSGGVRRSSSICIFSLDDEEMMNAKTGNWYDEEENPQRSNSNNSALLLRGKVTFEQFCQLVDTAKNGGGEPGFLWADNLEAGFNPCQPGWATVLTPNGIRTFDDIDIGSTIWSEDGWVKVTAKQATGRKEVWRAATTSGVFYGTDTHRVVSSGTKVELKDAETIDQLVGQPATFQPAKLRQQAIIDGLVLGDGSVHKASGNLVGLHIGKDDSCYFHSEIANFIGRYRPGISDTFYEVYTTITAGELPKTYERRIPARFMFGSPTLLATFLKGLYSANGSICGGRVTLKTASPLLAEDVVVALSSLGIPAYITTNKPTTVKFSNGTYLCKESYDVNITRGAAQFARQIGFIHPDKIERMEEILGKKQPSKGKSTYDITSYDSVGYYDVYDITVDGPSHTYWTGGVNVSNCAEIGLYAYDEDGNSGFQGCNLVEINGSTIDSLDKFLRVAKAAAIIGTLQAGYTKFPYLGEVTERIFRKEALLGVSITGIMDSPDVILNSEHLKQAVEIIRKTNQEIAEKIGINPAARLTTVKPSGTTSLVLGTASGIHPHHAKRYLRRVQANKMEAPLKYFKKFNPLATEQSFWAETDEVISFCIEVPDGSKLKNQLSAVQLLENVKLMKEHWVDNGKNPELCTQPWLSHNVSNTISIRNDAEWEEVKRYIFDNQQHFAGITLTSSDIDKDYAQAPLCAVYTANEIAKLYGDGSVVCSGIIEDALEVWKDEPAPLWKACSVLLGTSPIPDLPAPTGYSSKGNPIYAHLEDVFQADKVKNIERWLDRARRFSSSYFDDDLKKMSYCLKDVHNWKLWMDLVRTYKPVDYKKMVEEEDNTKPEAELACAGGACEITYPTRR